MISPLMKKLQAASTLEYADVLETSEVYNTFDFATTPIPALNIAYSADVDGGLTSGLHLWCGPSKHFKSMFCLISAAAYLKKHPGAVCIFYDNEFGTPKRYFESVGIDPSRVFHSPFTTLEELRTDIVNQLKTIDRGDKVVFIVDSLGMAASAKEVKDAKDGSEKADMTRAKVAASFARIILPHLRLKDVPVLAVQHVYTEMAAMYAKTIVSGGCLGKGTKIRMADGSLRAIEDVSVGELVDTLNGPREVTGAWNPETLENGTPETYLVKFDDGTHVICSDKHRFLNDNNEWVEAQNLLVGSEVITA